MFQGLTKTRKLGIACVCVAGVVSLAIAADTATDPGSAKLRAGIVSDLADLRGVGCMQSVERTRYASRRPAGATCAELVAAAADSQGGALEWRSRLRLNVTAGATREEFSLTDASRFERTDIGSLLSTANVGEGEFVTFLRNLTGSTAAPPFQSLGPRQTTLGQLQAFGFTLPSPGGVTFHGSVFALPNSGDPRQLTMEAENVGNACRIQYLTNYTVSRVTDRQILVPQSSMMSTISKSGEEIRTATYYSGCRRAAPDAAPPATASPKPLPPNIRFRIRFEPGIDSGTAATGDPVTAVIRTTIKDKQNGTIIHAGDRLHGRIALIEEYLLPKPRWNVAIAFETIERGVGDHGIDQGIEQPVSLVPVDDLASTEIQKLRPPNGNYYVFQGASVVLDQRFETEWETR